jgi:hypothetical protein
MQSRGRCRAEYEQQLEPATKSVYPQLAHCPFRMTHAPSQCPEQWHRRGVLTQGANQGMDLLRNYAFDVPTGLFNGDFWFCTAIQIRTTPRAMAHGRQTGWTWLLYSWFHRLYMKALEP